MITQGAPGSGIAALEVGHTTSPYRTGGIIVIKDRVGRSGRVWLLMHLNVNISLNI